MDDDWLSHLLLSGSDEKERRDKHSQQFEKAVGDGSVGNWGNGEDISARVTSVTYCRNVWGVHCTLHLT